MFTLPLMLVSRGAKATGLTLRYSLSAQTKATVYLTSMTSHWMAPRMDSQWPTRQATGMMWLGLLGTATSSLDLTSPTGPSGVVTGTSAMASSSMAPTSTWAATNSRTWLAAGVLDLTTSTCPPARPKAVMTVMAATMYQSSLLLYLYRSLPPRSLR